MSQNLQPSEEADERQLELARHTGEAYQRAVKYMVEEVADNGEMIDSGDYVVGYAQEEAEGMYRFRDGELEFEEPGEGENCHLEVVVAEASSGRFLPEVTVRATLTAEDGTTVGPEHIPFVWHPGVFHYGKNLELPGEGTYTIEIEAEPPEFPRHDEENGDRFSEGIQVQFEDVQIEPGQE